jgi:YVTN family beta-propeller protein
VRRPAAFQERTVSIFREPGLARFVYVPESLSGTVAVIDARSYRVVRRFEVGREPQHVTAAPAEQRLYAGAATGDSLTVIDSRSGRPARRIAVLDPYAVYPTPDGSRVIVVAHRERELRFLDAKRWTLLGSVDLPGGGPRHLAFTRDGLFALVTDESTGQLVKVDVERMRVSGTLSLGGSPVGVTLSRDGSVFYVANDAKGGVSVVHARALREVGFIPTDAGAHGLALRRDGRRLYVGNRQAGTISVIDVRKRTVRTWRVGGSPDGLQVSSDGRELWISNRFHSSVSVVDTRNGRVLHTIRVNGGPHGLAYS